MFQVNPDLVRVYVGASDTVIYVHWLAAELLGLSNGDRVTSSSLPAISEATDGVVDLQRNFLALNDQRLAMKTRLPKEARK